MKRVIIILFLVSICYGRPFILLDVRGDVYTSHQLPLNDSELDIGSASLLWRFIYGDIFTDGTAYWESSQLYGFDEIIGTTVIGESEVIGETITGTDIIGTTFSDGVFTVTGGIITGATWQGNVIDISDYTNLVGGTNITLVDDTLNVDDAFLVNDGDDTTTGTLTAAGFTTTGTTDTGVLVVDTDTLVSNLAGYIDKVGIGTVTPGTPGYAKLHIKGTDGNATGPHVIFETDADAYPLMQIFPWSHDNIAIGFDSYYDGTHRSSDAGSNLRLEKHGDLALFRYDSGVAQGAAITWNNALVIDLTDGKVTTDIFVVGSNPPATSTSAGTAGTITYDANYIYVAVANNSWKRAALSAWALDMLLLDDGVSKLLLDDGASFLLIR